MPMLTGGGGGESYTSRGGGRRTTTTSSSGSRGRGRLRSTRFFGGSGSTRLTGALTFSGCWSGGCTLQGQVGPASATFCGTAALAAATAGVNSGRLRSRCSSVRAVAERSLSGNFARNERYPDAVLMSTASFHATIRRCRTSQSRASRPSAVCGKRPAKASYASSVPSATISSFAASTGLPLRSRVHSATDFFGVAAGFDPATDVPEKRKSSVSEELSHGVCRPSVTLFTASRTFLKVSSIGMFCSLPAASSALVYGLLEPEPSSATAPGDVENDRKVPGAPTLASTMASPLPALLLSSGNGLLRQESSKRKRILLGTEASVLRTSLSRTACIGMSASRLGSMSVGIRKFSPSTWMPWPA